MHHLFDHRQHIDEPSSRRDYQRYLARRLGPMIHGLMLVATLVYLVAVVASSFLQQPPLPWWLRATPLIPLWLVARSTRRLCAPESLGMLTLLFVALLEFGINLNNAGYLHRQTMILPGLLLPVVSSVIWLRRQDFITGMLVCALGPLPMLLVGNSDRVQIIQYLVYMAIAITLAAVLRTFMSRTLYEQFRLERRLREQASTDGLTGLLLRNRFLQLSRLALSDIRHRQLPACVLYLDVDHFKTLNDDFGHDAGDAVLVSLADTLRVQTRPGDLIGRIGGEEFAMLLPGLNLAQASQRAEQVRLAVHAIARPDGQLGVSIGLVECGPDAEAIELLLIRADLAMRQAKSAGRDRVVSTVH
ncbi:GGDEF domain-containing protein [Rhodanobacter sp. AS-Z3]|uniref:GGDEF domain-containing protein n=1 Tax=Rhodanobacter sp. AS-Z3 TaxID=3031330 RepID=UPI00247A8331|nr:GGDEF domain-containing protein [Rhodanobacter sp. AS-Z3]WEN15804.1 GGDEF domain-containing protein [Rhodanobacter sp. AS-Z3]